MRLSSPDDKTHAWPGESKARLLIMPEWAAALIGAGCFFTVVFLAVRYSKAITDWVLTILGRIFAVALAIAGLVCIARAIKWLWHHSRF